jgi:acetyltransferase-like isoleucine patch superfamily enzyme
VLWTNPGVTLGKNVRLQKNSSLMAEAPDAQISIGEHSVVYEDTAIEVYGEGRVTVGSSAMLGGTRIVSRYGVSIGDRFLSSWSVFIQDYDSHPVAADVRGLQVQSMAARFRPQFDGGAPTPPPLQGWDFPGEPISIGSDVWVGANCTILSSLKE